MTICGCAAAHGGKPPAYRISLPKTSGGSASAARKKEAQPPEKERCLAGKPEAFRHVLRQSRDNTYRPVKLVSGRMTSSRFGITKCGPVRDLGSRSAALPQHMAVSLRLT